MSKFKQPTNPDRPKPPMTAFLAWFSPRKEKFKTDFPEMSYAQLCKKACEMWGEVQDKSEFETKSADDQKRYEDEMKEYQKSNVEKTLSKNKPKNKPKKKPAKKPAKTPIDPKKSKSGLKFEKSATRRNLSMPEKRNDLAKYFNYY